MPIRLLSFLALGVLLLAACQSKRAREMNRTTVGQLPKQVIDLYDAGKADGWMEIQADRNGWIQSIETDIELSDVPDNIMAAARRELPDGQITGAEFEINGREPGYEVKMVSGGRSYEFVYNLDAQLIEKEEELAGDEAPHAVLPHAGKAVPGGAFKSVERVTRGDHVEYHVKLIKNGASYKVVLLPDGTVQRVVREARAEIEIPIQ